MACQFFFYTSEHKTPFDFIDAIHSHSQLETIGKQKNWRGEGKQLSAIIVFTKSVLVR